MNGGRSVATRIDRLCAIDHDILGLLQVHRVLTTPQLIALVRRPERTVDYRLTRLRERYVVADQLEAEVEDLYGRIEVPDDWAEGLRQAIAAEVATRHEDTTAERELLATQHERLDAERYKLMEAYYATAIDVTLRREQERIGAELRTIESRQGVLDGSLDDWQEVMGLAVRFSTRCATAYRRAGDRTRRLLNAAVLDEVHVRAGHVVEPTYKEPFDLLFSSPKFEYGDVVGARGLEPPTSAV